MILAVLALAILAAPAQASVFGPRAGHSPNADDIRTAYWVAIVVAVILIVAVHAWLIAAILRFRAHRGSAPRRFVAGRGAFRRPAVGLGVVAVGVFVFAIVMAGKARHVEPTGPNGLGASSSLVAQVGSLDAPPDAKQLNINVVGQQWLWRFDYPQSTPGPPYSVFSYNELVVPVDTTVILHVTSTDVMHRWFVPALGGQVDAVPGKINETWFRADSEGVYPGQSTSYAATSYSVMRAWVRVVSAQAYQEFVNRKRQEIGSAENFVKKKLLKNAIPGTPQP
jgi:cytochrome c oxidase subunit II